MVATPALEAELSFHAKVTKGSLKEARKFVPLFG
jgi:hypothetical protein